MRLISQKLFILTLLAAVMLFALVAVRAPAALEVGATAPDFALADKDGKVHRLSDMHGKWVALVFYPADMTSGCTRQAQSIRDAKQELQQAGVTVFGLSVQDSASKAKFCEAESLNYTLLADTSKSAARDYDVLLPAGVAARKTYIVSPEGKIAARMDDISLGTHGADIARLVQQMKNPSPPPASGGRQERIKPGVQAPLFNLPQASSGKLTALSDLIAKKPVALVWVSIQCPVSKAYEARLSSLARDFPGVTFIGINSNSTEKQPDIAAHFKKVGLAFPVLLDRDNLIADAYGAAVTPEVFLIDKSGVLVYHGSVDDAQGKGGTPEAHYLEDALKGLAAGRKITPDDTRVRGCAIKRLPK